MRTRRSVKLGDVDVHRVIYDDSTTSKRSSGYMASSPPNHIVNSSFRSLHATAAGQRSSVKSSSSWSASPLVLPRHRPLLVQPLLPPTAVAPSKKTDRSSFRRRNRNPSPNWMKDVQQPSSAEALHHPKDGAQKPAPPSSSSSSSSGGEHELEEGQEISAIDAVYSLSPHPSSLPIPSFALVRFGTTAGSCIAEATVRCGSEGSRGGAGRAADAGHLLQRSTATSSALA